jgi:hypothetical protein
MAEKERLQYYEMGLAGAGLEDTPRRGRPRKRTPLTLAQREAYESGLYDGGWPVAPPGEKRSRP